MADESGERNEDATPQRLREAREQGNVARSQDVNVVAMIAALAGVLFALGVDTVRQLGTLQAKLLGNVHVGEWSVEVMAGLLGRLLVNALLVLAPLMFVMVVAAVAINFAQVGAIFTTKNFEPDPSRFDPVKGLQRICSMKGFFDMVKSFAKLVLLLGVLYLWIKHTVPGLLGASQGDPKGYLPMLLDLTGMLLVKLTFVLLLLSLADLAFVRWQYKRDMRMSKHDIKEEHKRREGDPRIKGRIRDLRRQMLQRSQSMAKVRDADVLITNPTHLAVAISYQHGVSAAPQVVAKGSGELARRMRETAARYQVPVVQNVPLARALYREVAFDDFVPEKWFPQVAKILIWVYSMRQYRASDKKE